MPRSAGGREQTPLHELDDHQIRDGRRAQEGEVRPGRRNNPSGPASGETGRTRAAATTSAVVATRAALGRLRNGLAAVRITKSTRVCVASDSTNQPVWKRAAG